MRVCDCEHPQMIYNRFIRKSVMVSCGKCDACKAKRQNQWIARMIQESKCWQFTYSLNLDYNEESLPKLDLDENGMLVQQQKRLMVPGFEKYNIVDPDELKFDTDYDYNYFTDRLCDHHTRIPVASVRDIQLFKKRLNTYIKREITGKYSNFRSCIVSEYGSGTFRPHYHGILFFNGSEVAAHIDELVRKAWRNDDDLPLGHAFAEPDRGHFSGYLAKYITKPSDLPSFYSHPSLRPFFLCSRRPPIGSLCESEASLRKVFDDCSPFRIEFSKVGEYNYQASAVPISKRLKDRLFPKCPLYSQLSVSDRTQLYRSAVGNRGIMTDFGEFMASLLPRVIDDSHQAFHPDVFYSYDINRFHDFFSGKDIDISCVLPYGDYSFLDSHFSHLIRRVTDNFTSLHALHQIHSVSCRVWFQSEIYGYSFDDYLQHIYRFYDNVELYKLSEFYQMQIDVLDSYPDTDILSFYPYTYFDVSPPHEQKVSLDYFETVRFKKKEDSKTKEKNAYFDRLKYRDPVLTNILIEYGKKCDENAEA